MKKFLMCFPSEFQVGWEINPWMFNQIGLVDTDRAKEQWHTLVDALTNVATIDFITPDFGCYDMVFAANAGSVNTDTKTFLASEFRSHERRQEQDAWKQWFYNEGYTVISQNNYCFEGDGDFLYTPLRFPGAKLKRFLGHGYRTDGMISPTIQRYLLGYDEEIIELSLAKPQFYHLDTCFCPLDDATVMYYPDAFHPSSLKAICENFTNRIEVTEEEARKFACNAIVVNNKVFMPKCFSAAEKLDKLGFDVHLFDMSEFIKSGGACKCLVLEIGS